MTGKKYKKRAFHTMLTALILEQLKFKSKTVDYLCDTLHKMLSRRCLASIIPCFPCLSFSSRSLHTAARDAPDNSLVSILRTEHLVTRYSPRHASISSFDILVKDLCTLLSRSSGHHASEIDHEELQLRMQSYKTNRSEWARYALEDSKTNYTRNLIDRPGGWASLVRLRGRSRSSCAY